MYDVIIVGSGPAGMSAAIYLRRANKKVLIIEKESYGGNMAKAPFVENYPGFSGSGYDLSELMFKPLEQDVDFVFGEVTNVIKKDDVLKISTAEAVFEAKFLIWATGSRYIKLNVPGEVDDCIHYCVMCDGPLYKDKEVAVIGDGNSALQYCLALINFGVKHVTLLTLTHELFGERKWIDRVIGHPQITWIPYWTTKSFTRVNGQLTVQGVSSLDAEKPQYDLITDGVFIAIGQKSDNEPLCNLKHIEMDKKGYVIVHTPCGDTDVEGVYAVGDCVAKPYKQIALAVGDGAGAAMEIIRQLNK